MQTIVDEADVSAVNIFGRPLQPCSLRPLTGYFRDGRCAMAASDIGAHVVCARMIEAFLEFSLAEGNDLVTPKPQHGFPGLNPGDAWCVCVHRWLQAYEVGVAPPIDLAATHAQALAVIPRNVLLVFGLH